MKLLLIWLSFKKLGLHCWGQLSYLGKPGYGVSLTGLGCLLFSGPTLGDNWSKPIFIVYKVGIKFMDDEMGELCSMHCEYPESKRPLYKIWRRSDDDVWMEFNAEKMWGLIHLVHGKDQERSLVNGEMNFPSFIISWLAERLFLLYQGELYSVELVN
jgi:hypothetical protein